MPLSFEDYTDFNPDYTPRQIFQHGVMGGCYFRDIYSSITNKYYNGKNIIKKYPFLRGISKNKLTLSWDNKNISINKYNVWSGMSLEYWEKKNWITKYNPYGWLHWYCDFYMGRRTPDDKRQIKRFIGIKNRFGKLKNKSPIVKQLLLQWGINHQ